MPPTVIFPSLPYPEPCSQPGYGCFSAARWADQSRNLSLFCRKGNIFQYGFSGIVGKPNMVKDNITPLIGKPVTALLDRMIENLIHTGNVGSCTDDCRKILECALQRVIQTGYYQKEHKECKHGEVPCMSRTAPTSATVAIPSFSTSDAETTKQQGRIH